MGLFAVIAAVSLVITPDRGVAPVPSNAAVATSKAVSLGTLPRDLPYVGSAACAACHQAQAQAWRGSQHAIALQEASAASVLGRFDGRTLRFGQSQTRYDRNGTQFEVRTEAADGKPINAEVTHTIGVWPLQQYLVTLADGRKQSLGVAWDSRDKTDAGQRWFHLFPGAGTQAGNPLHWSGIDQNWNYQCADCHSTNLRKRYDVKENRFDTTWSEISVGCEACHGPGQAHVQWAREDDPSRRAAVPNHGLTARLDERLAVQWPPSGLGTATRSTPRTSEREIEVCARCHARRGQFSDDLRAGDAFLDHFRPALLEPGLYYPDGQQRDEVYNYASFLQSRMYAAGVTCSDCHEPHGGKLRAVGNAVCTACHATQKFDTTAHHHHAGGSTQVSCVACHAPTTSYMGVDGRHDHSFRIPRPDRTVTLGVPNACTQCHTKQSADWAAAQIRTWYPQPKPGFQSFAETLAALEREAPGVADPLRQLLQTPGTPAIVKASALVALARHPALMDATLLAVAFDHLTDASALVRDAAIRVAALAEPAERARRLGPLLTDPVRLVRIDAARALAGRTESQLDPRYQSALTSALGEYIAAQEFNADRPEANSNLGALYLERGQADAAELAFQRAIARDPLFANGWIGLSKAQESRGNTVQAAATLATARQRLPKDAAIAHARGLLLVRMHQTDQALSALADAHRLAPDNARYHYVYAVALQDFHQPQRAQQELKAMLKRHPGHADARAALAAFSQASKP